MKRPAFKISAVAVLEESVDLLRGCPPSVLLRYYLGAVPFVLAFCGFALDLSRNPGAARRATAWALVMVVLYAWLKLWHAGFAQRLRAELGDDRETEPGGRWIRWASYLGWQGVAPWLLALSAVATLPFGWVYAYFHALSVTLDARRAWHQARDWPRQNHLLVGVLFVLACLVAVNVVALVVMLPMLLDSLLGIETAASQDLASMLNSTLLLVTLGTTYLLVGPVAKAAYVLRAFYGDSKVSGEDLKSRLGRLSAAGLIALLAAGLGFGPGLASPAGADLMSQDRAGTVLEPAALDVELDHELAKSDYDWLRLETADERELGLLGSMMQGMIDAFEVVVEWMSGIIDKILEWLRAGSDEGALPNNRRGIQLPGPRVLILLAGLVVLAALVYVLTRKDPEVVDLEGGALDEATVAAALAGDDAAADRMPYDDWLETARELMAAGDTRRAARAVYLATLSFLAHSELLLLARHKSNHDYGRELAIKGRRWPELLPAFADSVRVIERIWYGRHLAGESDLDRLAHNLETLRGLHEAG